MADLAKLASQYIAEGYTELRRVRRVFADKTFSTAVESSKRDNWLSIKASAAFERILECIKEMT